MNNSIRVTTHDLVIQQTHAKNLSLSARKKASSAISGLHDSRFRGRGMDYQESRVYQAGDDIRNMDWLVTARTGTAHTKLFQEERERPIHIVIDTNSSMKFGTRNEFKSVTAAKASALLAWSAVRNGDRVGVLSYGQNGIHHEKPVGGKRGMMRLIAHLVQADSQSNGGHNNKSDNSNNSNHSQNNSTTLDLALERLRGLIRPGSFVIIVSDFYHLNEDVKRHLIQLRKHNDVMALFISDPFEFKQIPSGHYGVFSQGKKSVLNTHKSQQMKKLHTQQIEHLESIYQFIQKSGVPVIPLQTNDNLTEKIKQSIKSPSTAWNTWRSGL